MGIVKVSDQMHENLRVASAALSRSINAQAEHWMRIGMLAELHPNLPHDQICQLLIRAEVHGGLDLARIAAQGASTPAKAGRRVQ
ncbi:MAG TPA: ParD-like family protein [Albitalea sp.]|nr:ParD-like family protein [Albitalea sp.]